MKLYKYLLATLVMVGFFMACEKVEVATPVACVEINTMLKDGTLQLQDTFDVRETVIFKACEGAAQYVIWTGDKDHNYDLNHGGENANSGVTMDSEEGTLAYAYPSEGNFKVVFIATNTEESGEPRQSITTYDIVILGVNAPPKANDVFDYVEENTASRIYVMLNDTDLDGDEINIESATQASNGTVTVVDNYITYTPNNGFLGDDSYEYTIVDAKEETATATVSLKVIPTAPQTPYGGVAWTVPGVIEVEDYDIGGLGISYNDDSPGAANSNSYFYRDPYTDNDVDINTTPDDGGVGFHVGWTEPNEWLEYTIDVAVTADYTVTARVVTALSPENGYSISVDGINQIGYVFISKSEGWGDFIDVTSEKKISLTAGQHIIKLLFIGTACDYNRITLSLD